MTPYVFSHSLAARIIILSFVFVSFVYSVFFFVVVVVVVFFLGVSQSTIIVESSLGYFKSFLITLPSMLCSLFSFAIPFLHFCINFQHFLALPIGIDRYRMYLFPVYNPFLYSWIKLI